MPGKSAGRLAIGVATTGAVTLRCETDTVDPRPSPPEGQCYDNGVLRDINPPTPGDLVITEVLPNPLGFPQDTAEWFELFVSRDVDLNGLHMGTVAGKPTTTLFSQECLTHRAGEFVVMARAQAGHALPRVNGVFQFTLVNQNGSLFVAVGANVLDAIAWGSSSAGQSLNLSSSAFHPVANDLTSNWCDPQSSSYDGNNSGTPGGQNRQCF